MSNGEVFVLSGRGEDFDETFQFCFVVERHTEEFWRGRKERGEGGRKGEREGEREGGREERGRREGGEREKDRRKREREEQRTWYERRVGGI